MIGRLNHVAKAVSDLDAAAAIYRDTLGAIVSSPLDQPEHGVPIIFLDLINARIGLISPLGPISLISKFLESHHEGGIHHVCYEVDDILMARNRLVGSGARVLGSGEPKTCAHGRQAGPVFLRPKDFCGTLIELEQA
jgi:methylmalonyl-CoA/ethylmalonyl-CoA epimerase